MIDRRELDDAKEHLESYLRTIGLNPDKPMKCLFHSPDNHPSMCFIALTNTVYCHACHTTADIVDVIAQVEGLQPKSRDAIQRAIEFAGTGIANNSFSKRIENEKKTKTKAKPLDWVDATKTTAGSKYLLDRGFTQEDIPTLQKFNVGYNAKFNCLIIPHDNGYYTARKIDARDKADRFKHNPAQSVELFNGSAIDTEEVIAVTEGAIDALSYICVGLPTVALGGAGTHGKFIQRMKDAKHKPDIIIAFDNDDAGAQSTAELTEKLKKIGVFPTVLRLDDSTKDANELFKKDRERFIKTVGNTIKAIALTKEIAKAVAPQADTPEPAAVATPAAATCATQREPNHTADTPEPAAVANPAAAQCTTQREPQQKFPNIVDPTDLTDYGIARNIASTFSDIVKYNFSNGGKFIIYKAPIWRLLNKDAELRIVIEKFRKTLDAKFATDRELLSILSKDNAINRVISMLRSFDELYVDNEDFNKHDELLNVINGVLNIKTRELMPHNGDFLFSKCANVEYNPTITSDTFDNFINAILPNESTRRAIQRFLGYCLTGSIAEEKALFVVGSGGNGKGTLFRSIMTVMGDFAIPFKIDAILAAHRSQDGQSATPEFNKLEHARLAIAEEVPKNRQLDAAQFKLLTGGDYLPIRRLHQEATTIKHVTHKLILSGNALPQLSDPDDAGLQRRLLVVQFPISFDDANRDPLLKAKLSTPNARSAILNWLLDGYEDYQQNGLEPSDEMQKTRAKYLADNDPLTAFIEDFCELDPEAITTRRDLLQHVQAHGNSNLRNRPDKEIVALFAKYEGISYVRVKSGYAFKGIKTRRAEPEEYYPPEE